MIKQQFFQKVFRSFGIYKNIQSLSPSPNNKYLCVNTKDSVEIYKRNAESGDLSLTEILTRTGVKFLNVVFSPDSKKILTVTEACIINHMCFRVYDIEQRKEIADFRVGFPHVSAIKWLNNTEIVVCCDVMNINPSIRLFNIVKVSTERIQIMYLCRDITFNERDGFFYIIGSSSIGRSFDVCSIIQSLFETTLRLETIVNHPHTVNASMIMDKHTGMCCSSDTSGLVVLWSEDFKQLRTITRKYWPGYDDFLFAHEGRALILMFDTLITVWDCATGTQISTESDEDYEVVRLETSKYSTVDDKVYYTEVCLVPQLVNGTVRHEVHYKWRENTIPVCKEEDLFEEKMALVNSMHRSKIKTPYVIVDYFADFIKDINPMSFFEVKLPV